MRERRKPVLIIQHALHEHPAAVRRALESQGIQTLWIHPYLGERYPGATEVSGLISLGGPMGANDDKAHPWIPPECALIRACIEAEIPVAGICLGGQMMARAMGGRVERNPIAEVGWFPIEVNKQGLKDRILGVAGPNPTVYHWHEDTFHLPPGAELLASSQHCPRQAYRIGEQAYGFQFHPEADHQLIHEWMGIEGIDEDIGIQLGRHGKLTVQDSTTQKASAAQGEEFSLKITAAIGTLFRRRGIGDTHSRRVSLLKAHAGEKTPLVIEFEGSDRKTQQLRGKILNWLTIPNGEFVIFQEESTVLWPIRLEDILSAKAAKPRQSASKSRSRPPRKRSRK